MRIAILIFIALTAPAAVCAQDLVLPTDGEKGETEESPFDDIYLIKGQVENAEISADELAGLMDRGLAEGREAEVAELAEVALGTPQDIRDEDARYKAALERTAERRSGNGNDEIAYRGRTMYDGIVKYQSDARINNAAGAAYLLLNRGAAALQYLNTARYLDPYYDEPIVNLGLFYRVKGKYETALLHYEEALGLSPANPITWYNKGIVLIRLGMLEDALDAFKKSASLDPKFRSPVRRTALVWLDIGDYSRAYSYLRRLQNQIETSDEPVSVEEAEELNSLLELAEKKLRKPGLGGSGNIE